MIIPEPVRALSPLSDYTDHYTLSTGVRATPEQWARAMFGDVPNAAERLIWSGCLRLRLSREPSPETVAGWRIAEQGPDWIRMEAASWFLTANIVVRAVEGQVAAATYLRYERRLGKVVWTLLSPVHRALVPRILRMGVAARQRVDGGRAAGYA
ncbi:DUF2867 domain-containing protein [Nonomuraea sp. PA05]|uniref:DUF2867 domain-containing protein n=1 Tax=Nonomuraea sp. PA05 TaxID=2604466 RepID=UPI0011D6B911|nr:DUF2867 domain-containing protein [Nonomuraea sp. PA05]TYB64737.1 DUF2867 domain-containing protein [Nonomuraea sp. PA05]